MNEFEFYEDLLNLPNLKIDSIERLPTKFIFHCKYTDDCSTCPNCLEETKKINQRQVHKFRDLKISDREVLLYIKVPQFHCKKCNRYYFDNPAWVEKGKSYTKRQGKCLPRYLGGIFEMSKKQAFTEVGTLVDMSHKTVERLFYSMAEKIIDLPKRYANVRKMGIDELSHRKGKKDFVCVLTDLDRGIQLDVLPNRKKATLLAHFQSLGVDFCNQIEVVSCDIWKTYINVAKECFPNCQVVIDRFHVVKALNEVLDTQRKTLRRENKDEDCFKLLKWRLFKRHEKCNEADKKLLNEGFEKSWLLEELYEFRKTFNAMFDVALNQKALMKSIYSWLQHAKTLNYKPLDKFIKTLENWKEPIAAFANQGISNAVTEELNNYLRYFKRISFGLPNFHNMRLRILVGSQ
jgi:transposase